MNRFLVLSIVLVLVSVLGEGLLLGVNPVLVESALDFIVELGSPDGLEGTETTGGFDVTNETDNLDWWAFKDGCGVDNILLDDLLTFTTLLVLDDVSHTSLVADEGSKVDWLGSIITGE